MTDESPHLNDFYVSTDKKLLNVPWLLAELQKTYWGGWYTLPVLDAAIIHSLCFGLYHRTYAEDENAPVGCVDSQVGFARVVTDYATYAWVCDVLVADKYRHKGLGKFLMNVVLGHPDVRPRSCMLTTKDAHTMYEAFGFARFEAMKRQGGQA